MKNLKFKRALITAKFYYDYSTVECIIFAAGYMAIGVVLHIDAQSLGHSPQIFLAQVFYFIGTALLGYSGLIYRKRKKRFRLRSL